MPVVKKVVEEKKRFKRWDETPRPKHDKRKKPKVVFACDECGKEFVITEGDAETRRFCSTQCADTQKTVPLIKRFAKMFKKVESGCWEWQGRLNIGGYGTIRDGEKMVLAHRVSVSLLQGNLPEDSVVCHRCNNRKCVNPVHLYPGTHEDNMADLSLANTSSFSKTEWSDRKQMYDLLEAGGDAEEIGAVFGVSSKTVRSWHKRFQEGYRIPDDL
jgi:transposase-like protein